MEGFFSEPFKREDIFATSDILNVDRPATVRSSLISSLEI
jgi:hypothetical protein